MSERPTRLTSLQNDQVKALVRLRKRRERDSRQLTLIEEPLVIQRALAAGYPLSAVYYCPELLAGEHHHILNELRILADRQPGLSLVEVTAPVMTKVAYRETPAGLLIVAPQVHTGLADLGASEVDNPLLVVLESVEKPGNLGAVLRIADGAGAQAVIVCGQGTDLFNPNVLRASRGAFFSVPTVACPWDELQAYLGRTGIRSVATSPAATEAWDRTDLTGPTAILLGTEHDGLSQELLAAADTSVNIPMKGAADSLNVATAAAVLLYEAVRQRGAAD